MEMTMAFSANQRVRVTSQHSEHRRHLGTVETAAADSPDGFNKVRLDGQPVGKVFNFSDNELGVTNFSSNVDYVSGS
jgi:hypothetical protein